MTKQKRWTIIWAAALAFFLLAWWDLYQGFILIGNPPSFESKRFDVFLAFQIVPIAFWGYLFWLIRSGRKPFPFVGRATAILQRIPFALKIVAALFIFLVPAYLFMISAFGDYPIGYWFRLFMVVLSGFLATILFFPTTWDRTWFLRFSALVMTAAVVFITFDWMNNVTSYPFSLSWSEGNRMWDYSMLFGSSRYLNPSQQPIFTFIEVGRQVVFAIPFLFPKIDIFGFRLWSSLIWILPPLLLGAACVIGRPYSKKRVLGQIGFILWMYYFLSQGPIYPPLLLSAALVVVGVRQRSWIVGMVAVMLASYYCEMSRWTWMYAPGLWAGMLTLLAAENPSFTRDGWKKLVKPAVYGISGYFGGEFLPRIVDSISNGFAPISGVTPIRVPGEFSQPMLWDRLFPNPTYPAGILLGTIWVGLPIVLLIYWTWKTRVWKPNWLQALPVLVLTTVFLILGLIVSVKIGGGGNLHNLDMLWVTLALIAGWIWKQWMDRDFEGMFADRRLLAVLCIAIAIPFTTMVESGTPLRLPENYLVQGSLSTIRKEVEKAKKTGKVLFMDQRQLLTFGYVEDVPLVFEYEKKYVMNQAMSANEAYFTDFYKKLDDHEYSLIVSEPLHKSFAEESIRNYGEENNAWVFWVSRPLLKRYKILVTMDEVGVQLLVPRD